MELSRYRFDHDHSGITSLQKIAMQMLFGRCGEDSERCGEDKAKWNDRAAAVNTVPKARVALQDGICGAIRGRSCLAL